MTHTYAFFAFALLSGSGQAQTLFYQGFDDVASLTGAGWVLGNQSEPLGSLSWRQADGFMNAHPAYSGPISSYAQSDFQATNSAGSGIISDWIISREVLLNNGDMIRLFALSFNSSNFPDRIEVRISPNGGSDIGTSSADVGDFSTLVFSVNENLDTVSFPSIVAGDNWTSFESAVAGLSGATSCRIGLRYFVTDGGSTGVNSSTVGIDDLEVYSGQSSVGIGELTTGDVAVFPNPASDHVAVKFGTLKGKATITLADLLGKVHSSETLGEVYQRSFSIDPRALANGTYIVSVVMEGASFQQRLVVAH